MCLELIAREQKSQVGKPTEFLNLARNHFIEILLRNTLAKDPFPDIWHCGDSWYGGVWMGTHYAGENVSEYFKGEMIFWVFVALRGLCTQCGVPCSKQLSYQVSCPPLWGKNRQWSLLWYSNIKSCSLIIMHNVTCYIGSGRSTSLTSPTCSTSFTLWWNLVQKYPWIPSKASCESCSSGEAVPLGENKKPHPLPRHCWLFLTS